MLVGLVGFCLCPEHLSSQCYFLCYIFIAQTHLECIHSSFFILRSNMYLCYFVYCVVTVVPCAL